MSGHHAAGWRVNLVDTRIEWRPSALVVRNLSWRAPRGQLAKKVDVRLRRQESVASVTDANGHATTYKYLDGDTLQSVVSPDRNTQLATTYSYDTQSSIVVWNAVAVA